MNIKIDKDYSIKSDFRNVILVENKITKDGDNIGTEYDSQIGFYATVEQALKDYLRIKINTSEATSIKELLTEIKEIREIIEKILQGA